MHYFVKIGRDKLLAYSHDRKRGLRIWHRVICSVLCAVLLGTTVGGPFAVASATDDVPDIVEDKIEKNGDQKGSTLPSDGSSGKPVLDVNLPTADTNLQNPDVDLNSSKNVLLAGNMLPDTDNQEEDNENYGIMPLATYPGNRTVLSAAELDQALAEHTVRGITPAGTTLNLFDYVATYDGAIQNDIVNAAGTNGVEPSQWNLGINENRLLIFCNPVSGAGYWNIGGGAGRQWARDNTNMKGIVEATLKNGYPSMNLAKARSPLDNIAGYDSGKLPYNLNRAENAYAPGDINAAPALSSLVLQNAGGTYDSATDTWDYSRIDSSLAYLFNPNIDLGENVKRSKENITGLFQIDEAGYYYYDARKNFAEFVESPGGAVTKDGKASDGHFVLYDGGAVWRTDAGWDGTGFNGDKSVGNFYPFNKGREVFDCLETRADGSTVLSSSEGLDSSTYSNAVAGLPNRATGENVLINHHIGMTLSVDFVQPEDGRINMGAAGKQDMVFEFSGDDDIWIFVDDVLVLDLGGVHSELYGTINFSTGEVVTGQSWRTNGMPTNPGGNPTDSITTLYQLFVNALGQANADALSWTVDANGHKTFASGSNHTLKLFYLERGNYDSSLALRFNLQPALYHSIKKVDQNGQPLEGVEFDLYEARLRGGVTTETADVDDYETIGGVVATLKTARDGAADFFEIDESGEKSPFNFSDRYSSRGTVYYILKETKTAPGYRTLPKDIVLKFNPDTTMLVVANRYQTGAYASFFSNMRETGTLTYGQFDSVTGDIAASGISLAEDNKKEGLVIAVPMLLQKNMTSNVLDGKWMALYGNNTAGFGTVIPENRTAEEWRKAILKAALYQCSDTSWMAWYIKYNPDTLKLDGLLEDLPGRADRYALYNDIDADMKMVYGIIEPYALEKLGIRGGTSEEKYHALENYVQTRIEQALAAGSGSGESREVIIDRVITDIYEQIHKTTSDGSGYDSSIPAKRGFSFLNTDQFQREFRSTIYIPNERRELRVWKVDEDGAGINGVEFTLYKGVETQGGVMKGDPIVTGKTARVDGLDGVLIFTPDAQSADGYARVNWVESSSNYYVLQETRVPEGYEKNSTEIPIILGHYSLYADAGDEDDGVTVMAGVGKLMQTMTKYAADDTVNITLRDVTAIAQKQDDLESWSLDGWKDDILAGTTDIPRSMNLHYGKNAMVNYGLHDEDGGRNIYPFFTTDVGFLRTRIVQNRTALVSEQYSGSINLANWDDLGDMDLTNLFNQLNIVVVTNKKTTPSDTGKLEVSKSIGGEGLQRGDYTKNFTFTVSLKNRDGGSLAGTYRYYGKQRSGYIQDGGSLSLRHDEAITILGLPSGTQWSITETPESGWYISPTSGTLSGEIKTSQTAFAAFRNYRGVPALGDLSVSKMVTGDAGDTSRDFHFTVTLSDTTISGTYGNMVFKNGVAVFTLRHNERKTAVGLPAGIEYAVVETEANQDGYTTSSTGGTGTITENAAIAVFTNSKNSTVVDPKTGSLTVMKIVSGDQGETNRAFSFTVTLSDTSISGKYGDMTFIGGVATFTLKHNESLTATGLPVNVRYTVVESNNEGYTVTKIADVGTITENKTVAVFTNSKNGTVVDPKTGNLTVTKIVSGNQGETDRAFSFVVTLSDASISGKYGDMTFISGVATFTLKHGESLIATGLPANIQYTVVESNNEGYTVTKTGDTGTIIGGTTIVALFNNHKDGNTGGDKPTPPPTTDTGKPSEPKPPIPVPEPEKPVESKPSIPTIKPSEPVGSVPDTGDEANMALWWILMGVSGVGIVVTLVISRQRKKRAKHSK